MRSTFDARLAVASRRRPTLARVVLVIVAVVVALTGCVRVRPYQRQRLAHPAMQEPASPATARADQHTFEVREGSGGAAGPAGGGCGCN